MNTCTVTVSRPTGEVVASSLFELATGPGPLMQRVWRDEFSDRSAIAEAGALVADVECHPYTEPASHADP
jgi:hypothetical protein